MKFEDIQTISLCVIFTAVDLTIANVLETLQKEFPVTKRQSTTPTRFSIGIVFRKFVSNLLPLGQHLVVVVYVNLSLSSYNNYNQANNQLCNHLLDLLQFFKYYHMFLNFYWLIKKVLSINQNILFFYIYSCKKIFYVHCSIVKTFKQ